MTEFLKLNVVEYTSNKGLIRIPSKPFTCFCCLEQNVTFVNLATCKHTSFFEKYFSYKIELQDALVCYSCHSTLKKIDQFKQQVDENLILLREQASQLKKHKKRSNLRQSKLEITSAIDSQTLEATFDMKVEVSLYDTTTEIKIEHESSSDFGIDLPLSEIKKEIKTRIKKKKKSERKSTSNEKYEGKIRIVTLNKKELVAEREADRVRETYLKLPYKCEDCISGFDHELTLQEHIEKRHTKHQGSFVCDICKSVLNTEPSYKEHCKRHYRRYECEECGKRNNTLHAVIKHYNEQHGTISTNFTCECGFSTGSHRSYRYHRDKHKEKQQCTECGNTFVNKTGLKVHMFTVHKQSTRVYSCAACNKVYNAKSGLLAHTASVHGGANAYCTQCRTHFRTENSLRHHMKTHSSHVSDTDKRFVCNECGIKFLTKPSLQEHIDWVHLKNVKYECGKCSKVFKNSSALKKHRNFVHDKKRPPRNKICDHCGRGFTTLTILRSHIRTHTGERPLQCAHCPATFAHSAALYTHNKMLHANARA